MIVVYTGEGKGKTSAALGQLVRALGRGLRAACVQFMKRADVAGEQQVLRRLLGEDFRAGGLGFFRDQKDYPGHRAACLEALNWAENRLALGVQVCVLDESIYALNHDLLLREELENLLDAAAQRNAHVVLTGRSAPEWLVDRADIVTEMTCRKHHYALGRHAVRGVEF